MFAHPISLAHRPARLSALTLLVVTCLALRAETIHADIIASGTAARYIQVIKTSPTNAGDLNRFHIGEIEAFLAGASLAAGIDNANDQALSGLGAVGSTVSGTPFHGADGNLVSGVQDTGSAAWTRQNPLPIIAQVDLGSTKTLDVVRVWQRGASCCQERLNDFDVALFADGGGTPGTALATLTFPTQVSTNSFGALSFTTSIIRPGGPAAVGTETVEGTDARFIRVTKTSATVNPGDLNRFQIGEVEAFLNGVMPAAAIDNANDQALGTLGAVGSTVSGNVQHGADSNLVSGVQNSGAATWTRQDPLPIIGQVDLGTTRNLDIVRIWQRSDCCSARTEDFNVSLYSDNGDGTLGTLLYSEDFPGQVTPGSFQNFSAGDNFLVDSNDLLQIELDAGLVTGDTLSVGSAGGGNLFIEPLATLDVTNLAGTLAYGQVYDVLDFATVTGQFETVNLPALAANLAWDTRQLYTTGLLAVVPEPTSLAVWAIFAALGAAVGWRRRRRA